VNFLKKIKTGFNDEKQTTINIGLFKSGSAINTIPEITQIRGEIRSYQKNLFEKHQRKIKKFAQFCAQKHGIKMNFYTAGFCPGYEFKKDDPLIKMVVEKIKASNLKPRFYCYSGVSDANILNKKGIKTVVLSDGVMNPHSTKEKISLASLIKIEEILKKIILI